MENLVVWVVTIIMVAPLIRLDHIEYGSRQLLDPFRVCKVCLISLNTLRAWPGVPDKSQYIESAVGVPDKCAPGLPSMPHTLRGSRCA